MGVLLVDIKARYWVPLLIVLIFMGVVYVLFLPSSPSESTEETTKVLTTNCYFEVKNVNLNNHTAIAKLDLEIIGIQNLTIGLASKRPDVVYAQVSDSNNDEVNCTLRSDYGNGTYSYEGILDDASWYLYNFGEGYPYDPTFIELKIMRLEFALGDIRYGASVFENYSYHMGYTQSIFSGFNYDDLTYTWQINNKPDGGTLVVQFVRNWLMPTFIIIFPLIWLLGLAIFAPSLTNNRTNRITLYSSILVFAPMFIFAIQTFISPRASPSIPEFMGVMLMLISVSFLLATLPQLTPRDSFLIDCTVLVINFAFIGIFGFLIFIRLIIIQYLSVLGVLAIVMGLIAFGYVWRIRAYNNQLRLQREEEENERLRILREEEDNRLRRLREQEIV